MFLENTQKHMSNGILTFDIGGSNIKATVLDLDGEMLQPYKKIPTPRPATPANMLAAMHSLVKDVEHYSRITVGFPGYIKKGIVWTAPNLGNDIWKGVNLNQIVSKHFEKPVRIVNDADLQGLALVSGSGLEMVITLGTGFGTALLQDGNLLPHIELAHHALTKKHTYDQYVGNEALKSVGEVKWNRRIGKIIVVLKTVFNYDRLFISGGNADKITIQLDHNIEIVKNKDGIKGGSKVWSLDEDLFMKSSNHELF